MTWPATLALALVAMAAAGEPRARHLPLERAEYFASAIAAVTDDPREAAGLEVLLVREGGLDPAVEHCFKAGPGGLGAWQLNPMWQGTIIPCSHPISQAYRALDLFILGGFPQRPGPAFARYLGAGSWLYPEARARLELWQDTLARIECQCSVKGVDRCER